VRSHLTQQEVTNLLNVTPAVVSRHESGEKLLSHENVLKHTRLYKVWAYELFPTTRAGRECVDTGRAVRVRGRAPCGKLRSETVMTTAGGCCPAGVSRVTATLLPSAARGHRWLHALDRFYPLRARLGWPDQRLGYRGDKSV
jgi:hypothetical protein